MTSLIEVHGWCIVGVQASAIRLWASNMGGSSADKTSRWTAGNSSARHSAVNPMQNFGVCHCFSSKIVSGIHIFDDMSEWPFVGMSLTNDRCKFLCHFTRSKASALNILHVILI